MHQTSASLHEIWGGLSRPAIVAAWGWGASRPVVYIGVTLITVICRNEPSIGFSAGEIGGST